MRVHLDLVGWLHCLWGGFGLLAGLSLLILAGGTALSLGELGTARTLGDPAVWVLALPGLTLALIGLLFVRIGRSVIRRRVGGRLGALACALPNAVVVPFGTALGVYTCWALLNDDARRAFGRPERDPAPAEGRPRP